MNQQLFWQQSLAYLKGIGPKRAAILAAQLSLNNFEDLLYFFPRKYIDRTKLTRIADISPEQDTVSLLGTLSGFDIAKTKTGTRLLCRLSDASGSIELIWFQGVNYISTKFKPGLEVLIFGKASQTNHGFQIAHPEIEDISKVESIADKLVILSYYSGTEYLKRSGVDSKTFRSWIQQLLSIAGSYIVEWLPEYLQKKHDLIPLNEAITQIHFPVSWEAQRAAATRIKFDEFFLFQLHLALQRAESNAKRTAVVFPVVGNYFLTFYHQYLPFELTNAQKRVIREIRQDVAKPLQMNRLIQGDVGSGKTIVALFTMLMALDNGFQGAMIAPTEILAEQHYRTWCRLLEPMQIRIALLTGSTPKKQRQIILDALQRGELQILIGTHALIEPPVKFFRLGLTIIDEQHKFGVLQRGAFWQKAQTLPHHLAMTATPIPRTLAMTLYGDIDISAINELPPGRKPIITKLLSESQRLQLFGLIRQEINKGHQVYIVYPLIEENQKLDLLAAEQGLVAIKRAFAGIPIGFVHGKLPADVKETEMKQFLKKETKILISTTVIEVGVDVPNATAIVIEHAERFGLSQLHQLRGRVGRSANQSYCILMTPDRISSEAKKRLEVVVQTQDGFEIAEYDLKFRGPGDFLGVRQSGIPEFKMGNLVNDQPILTKARWAAFELLKQDPNLKQPENQIIAAKITEYRQELASKTLLA